MDIEPAFEVDHTEEITTLKLANLTFVEKAELVRLMEQKAYYESGRLFYSWFDKPYNYPKHIEFLNAGREYKQKAFLAGNRVGKSQTGAYETTCHLTGIYPGWWTGKRFDTATDGWVVGKTGITVRDTVQLALLGSIGEWGTGMIPRDLIVKIGKNSSSVDYIQVKHSCGDISTVYFKSNDSGRQSFEGTAKDFIWLDEETDQEVYFECLVRTMTTDGIVFTTFTPMKGLSPLIMSLLEGGNIETPKTGISVTTCSWDDAPHLSEATKLQMLNDLPPWQRLARSRGIPSIGSGVIYPIDPQDYTVQPIEIPANWKRLASLDVGWNRTACLWLAINPDDNVMYAYSEHYRGQAEPIIHAEAIKARGSVPVVIDSAAHGRSQKDGEDLFTLYEQLGLTLYNANKSVETGLTTVWSALSFGKLKIFSSCTNLLTEMKTYRRDDKGVIVKSNDHLCDCLRYGVMTKDVAKDMVPKAPNQGPYGYNRSTKTGL